ncbi:hypothetical protein AB0J47_36625, partial [Nocardia sp. NPDC049737]|uniref:hypothetical protein n=1 Tax=Nocardia sp. NPDC049737 TaxID=3154358 RepID=UPI003446A4A7
CHSTGRASAGDRSGDGTVVYAAGYSCHGHDLRTRSRGGKALLRREIPEFLNPDVIANARCPEHIPGNKPVGAGVQPHIQG